MKKKVSMPVKAMPMKPSPMPSAAMALQRRVTAAMQTPQAMKGSKMKKT
jgi:hypothetical protein